MIARTYKTPIFFSGLLLATAVFTSSYTNEPLLLLAPVAVVLGIVFLQQPAFLFYTLLATIPWSVEYRFPSGLGTDLPDEPLMVWAALTAALLWCGKKRTASMHPLFVLLLVGWGWMLLTALASSNQLYSAKYAAAKTWYLLAFVGLPLLVDGGKAFIKRSAVVLFVSMLAATVVTLYQHGGLGFSFATVNEAVQPFFRNHVNYAALLVLLLPLQVAFLRMATGRRQRLALWASVVMVLAALYLSYSRGAWLAAVAGLAGFWLIKKGWLFKTFVAGVVAVALGAGWLLHQDRYLQFAPDHNSTIFHLDFGEHLAATYAGKDVSTAERFYRWTAVPPLVASQPFVGFGPSTFYLNYKPYTTPVFRTWVSGNEEQSTVHNYFLLLVVEQGLPGLLLFLALLGTLFWTAQAVYRRTTDAFWKTVVAAAGAILLMQCTLNFLSDLVETDKVGSVFYLCVAVLVMADRQTPVQKKHKLDGRRGEIKDVAP